MALALVLVLSAGCGADPSTETAPPAPAADSSPLASTVAAGTANARWDLAVEGMHCDGCAKGIRSELMRLAGVSQADVDWEAGTAVVSGDSNLVSVALVLEVISEAGYHARLPDTPPSR